MSNCQLNEQFHSFSLSHANALNLNAFSLHVIPILENFVRDHDDMIVTQLEQQQKNWPRLFIHHKNKSSFQGKKNQNIRT